MTRRILFAWELGFRLNHLSNIAILARAVGSDGHVLGAALRELHNAPLLLSEIPLQYYQAPFHQSPPPLAGRHECYAHVLYSGGFVQVGALQASISAWSGIFAGFRPDVIVCDHSPTALLASRSFDAKRIVVGTGFCVPPAGAPLGVLPDLARTPERLERLARDEASILAVVNRAAQPFGIAPLERLADLYADADGRFLLTLPELDSFGPRDAEDYLGVWSEVRGGAPDWPPGDGKRVFVYLSAFPGHRALLDALRATGSRALVYSGNLPPGVAEEFGGDGMRFVGGLVDLPAVARGCDLFVSHGSHTSVCQTLLGGVPQLMIPIFREQEFTARRVEALGAGRSAERTAESYRDPVEAMVADPRFGESARRFASRYRDFDPARSAARFRERLISLTGA